MNVFLWAWDPSDARFFLEAAQRGRRMKSATAGIAMALLLAGCSNANFSSQHIQHDKHYGQGAFGPGPLNFEHMKHETYDPRLTNIGTSYRDASVPHRTLADDAAQVEGIVESQGFRSGAAIVNGGDVYVKAYPPPSWSKEQTSKRMEKLKRAFEAEIPRYQVHVR